MYIYICTDTYICINVKVYSENSLSHSYWPSFQFPMPHLPITTFKFLFTIISFFKLEDNRFTILYWFLVFNVNQL